MKRSFRLLALVTGLMCCCQLTAQDNGEYAANYARGPRFRALIHYEPRAEEAHVQFDKQAIEFFRKLTYGEGWTMDVTTSLADYPYEKLKDYDLVYLYLAWNSKEEECLKVIEQYNVKGPNVVHHVLTAEEQNALESYLGIHSWPFYRIIDRNGNVIDVDIHPESTERIKKILDKLDNG